MADCKWPDLYTKWSLGDPNAALVMGRFARLSQLADDFVDDEVGQEDRSKNMISLLHICLVELPANPFYYQHQASYFSLIAQVLVMYDTSNQWYDDPSEDVRMFSFVYREATELLISHTAYLVGGLAHARTVVLELRKHWSDNDPDKLGTWTGEHNK